MGRNQHRNQQARHFEVEVQFPSRRKSASSSSGRSSFSSSTPNSPGKANGRHEPVWRRLKTEMCRNLRKEGRCKYAETCWYAHTEEELRSADDVQSGKAIAEYIREQNKEKERRKEERVAAREAGEERADVREVGEERRQQRPRNNRNKKKHRVQQEPALPAIYSMPPPNVYVPFLHNSSGVPQSAQYAKATLLISRQDEMLHQERIVIDLRECVRKSGEKLQEASTEQEKSKIKKEIDRFKQSLKVAEAAYAVKVEAFLKARPTDCGQQKRTEEKQDSQSGTASQH